MTSCACGHANRAGAKFCSACGRPLAARCGGCGAELPAGARFCDACGAATAAAPAAAKGPAATDAPRAYTPKHLAEKILTTRAALEGERKVVTVLFGDVADFTSLSTRLDPEDLHGIMDGCFQPIIEAVHRYEGTVNQFTGDGVMALFGAPIAHEDHAVRAIAAAVAIQRALARYAEELERTRKIVFGMRIGLNSGPVVVGKIGDDLRMDYTAQGETVNLAARLQSAATKGAVLVSEATRRLASRAFLFEARGSLSLKGIAEPIDAFVVTGERPARSRFELSAEEGLTPLVGRRRELAFLDETLARVRDGRGHAVSVVGEAGIGKSRLVHEIVRGPRAASFGFARAQGLPHGESAPFDVVRTLLVDILGRPSDDGEAARAQHAESALSVDLAWAVPYVKHLLALPAPELDAEGLDATQRKRRTFDAVKAVVARTAAARPLVLIVEDLQWIDRSSEELLRALVDGLADQPVLVLTTVRTGFVPAWDDRSFHQRLVLEPLDDEEALEIVGHLTSPSAAAREAIAARAEGNPLFLEELARYVRGGKPGHDELPARIVDLLTARIDRLPESLKRTLQRASVLGPEFPASLLAALGEPEEDVDRAVSELVSLELLQESGIFPEHRLSFRQPLVQDVAYRGLLLKTRAELHGRAGRALERLATGRLDEAAAELARHFARSADRPRAVHYLVRAGGRAASLFAYPEAEARYQEALEIIASLPELAAERPSVVERLGDVAAARGEVRTALGHWAESLAGLGADGDGRRAADLHRKIAAGRFDAGESPLEAIAQLEQGLAALGDAQQTLEAARVHQELARIHFHRGDNEGATEAAERALALGEGLDAPDVVSHAFNTIGVAAARRGELERGAAFVEKSLERALAHGLGSVACRAYANLGVMLAPIDHERSGEYCRRGLALAQAIGDQLQQSWLYCAMAGGHCTLSGDYDEGVKAAEAAADLDRRLGQGSHLPIPIIILAQIYQCRGDGERSARHYREALELAERLGDPQLLVPCYEGLATLAIEREDEEEADRWLARSRAISEKSEASGESYLTLPFLC